VFDIDVQAYSRHWWVLALRGALAVLFGILAIIWPGATIVVLVLLFGAYAFINGLFLLIGSLSGRISRDHKWLTMVEGMAGILIGIITFFYPGLTAASLLFLIAIWALVTGIMEIITAISMRHQIEHEWLQGISGVLSLIIGVVFLAFPIAALATIAFLIGIYALVIGVVMLVLAFRLRRLADSLDAGVGAAAAS
jgi:uncharacterized membrane protein HdeD (DUF308 family)